MGKAITTLHRCFIVIFHYEFTVNVGGASNVLQSLHKHNL